MGIRHVKVWEIRDKRDPEIGNGTAPKIREKSGLDKMAPIIPGKMPRKLLDHQKAYLKGRDMPQFLTIHATYPGAELYEFYSKSRVVSKRRHCSLIGFVIECKEPIRSH